MAGRSWDSLYHLTFEAPKILYYSGLNKSTTKSNTAAEVVKFHIILSGLLLVCGLESCVPVCACKPPAPLLSFSYVKKKGEKEKALCTFPAGRGRHCASRRALCRCGLWPSAREIKPFRHCVAAGAPANAHAAAAFCFLPAPPRLCVATRCGSRATNSPGAPLHKENQGTRADALPLPVSSA